MATDIIARGMITEYKSGTNISFKENDDGSVTISASGDVSSEDTVARDTIDNHKLDKNNPHHVTAEQIGLNNVDNTADSDKPISTAVQTALDDKADKTTATKDSNGLMSADDKAKLDGIEENANHTAIDSELSDTSENPVQNKVIKQAISTKVDKISGKNLSTNDLTDTLKNNYDAAYTHSQSAHAPSSAQANIIETIKVNNTALTPTNKTVNITVPSNTDRYVNKAVFVDDSTSTVGSPIKMTLTRAGSDTNTITANIPKVSSSSAGVVPKGSAVSSQSKTTKFLREDGTWAAPSYTTNTDTKVTAVGNHYTPVKSTTKSASGGTLTDIANSTSGTQVVTGVEMDAKGHVTGVTSTALKTTVPEVISLTRAEYDNISTKNPNAYYMITDDAGFHTSSPRILSVGEDKQYTSFTAAMRAAETIKNRKVVINVYSGEYDIYNELGGDDFIKGIGDATWIDGFQPIMSNDVEIHGIGNVTLKLEVPDDIFSSYKSQAQLVSVVNNTIGNVLVDNITFKCKNNRYAIHDECLNNVEAAGTKHIFKNCRFYHNNTLCCVGIGTVTGHFEIENCYFENTGRCFFLHDWRLSTGGSLLISNSIFSSTNNEYDILLGVNSTNTFNVYLSNNYLNKLHIRSIDIDNYATNIFRVTGIHNTINSATIVPELSNPYPINLFN